MNTKQFAVNWNNHMSHVKKAFDYLLNNSELIDVTLYAEGTKIGAHKMLLSACSTYFRNIFREFPQEHPIIVLKGVKCEVLTDILKFIYHGEVSVASEIFDSFIQTAEFLEISGLTNSEKDPQSKEQTYFEAEHTSPRAKRSRRKRPVKKLSEIKDDENNLGCAVGAETNEQLYNIASQSNNSTNKSPEKLTCPICYKVFTHPYSLHHHKPVHLGRTKCPVCSVVLSRKYNLKMHMKSRHNIV